MMQLRIQINDTTRDIDVPDFMLAEGEDFFAQMKKRFQAPIVPGFTYKPN